MPTRCFNLLCLALALALAPRPVALAQAKPGQTLYLLAGTPTSDVALDGLESHPVNLYWAAPDRTGRLARVIVGLPSSIQDLSRGLWDVADDGQGTLFVIWPVTAQGGDSHITAIDETQPLDVFETAYKAKIPPYFAGGTGAPGGVLLIISNDLSTATRVLPQPNSSGAMIEPGELADFRQMRYAGRWRGAEPDEEFNAQAIGGNLMVPANMLNLGTLAIAPLPPDLPLQDRQLMLPRTVGNAAGKTWQEAGVQYLDILFSTGRFLGFEGYPPGFRIGPGVPRLRIATTQVFMYDREHERWTQFEIPQPSGIPPPTVWSALTRTFGEWLAYPVISDDGLQGDTTGERRGESPWYPDSYASYQWMLGSARMPGIVWLRNLADGRMIKLETGIRDTEILDVETDGRVVYRADDKVYTTRIDGGQLAPAVLAAQGEDMPEVHWAFWASQPPPMKPIGLDSAVPHGAGGGE